MNKNYDVILIKIKEKGVIKSIHNIFCEPLNICQNKHIRIILILIIINNILLYIAIK